MELNISQKAILSIAMKKNIEVIFAKNANDFKRIGIHLSNPDYLTLINALQLALNTQNKTVVVHPPCRNYN